MRDDVEVAEMVERFCASEKTLPHDAWDTWSAWEWDAWRVMTQAHVEEMDRRYNKKK